MHAAKVREGHIRHVVGLLAVFDHRQLELDVIAVRASLFSRFHRPWSGRPSVPQRKPMEPLGSVTWPSSS